VFNFLCWVLLFLNGAACRAPWALLLIRWWWVLSLPFWIVGIALERAYSYV